MDELMLGNAAVARGAYEAGVRVVASYPGTPSTEITENIVKYDEMYAEWAPNEKVAAEVAIGASIAGARAMSCMKHVGLNVMADPVFTVSYTGVNGGLVFCVADDPGMHSSQNEQDSRHYAIAAKMPMLEPSDSAECLSFTKLAFELSEQFDTPVFLRLSTRVSHSQGPVPFSERAGDALKPYEKNPRKYVMMPAFAKDRHVIVEERTKKISEYANKTPLNRREDHDSEIGVITAGISYLYAKEALGDRVGYYKLGLVNPLPKEELQAFCASYKRVYVIEELDPVIETFCRANGMEVIGKEEFTMVFEYTPAMIAKAIFGEAPPAHAELQEKAPARPPVMCPGCPHRGAFYVLKKLGCVVSGDIGCYTLGATPPLESVDTTICMGASVSAAHGMVKARGPEFASKLVSVIGDSTFIHSGITGLIDTVYNKGNHTVIILDNSITGMTGHQENPTTGITIRGEKTRAVDLEALCHAIGVDNVSIADPFDLKGFEAEVRRHLSINEPSVLIAQRPCALLKKVRYEGTCMINDACKNCGLCAKLGCPAIRHENGHAVIDQNLCVGCGLCVNICPFGAIAKEERS